MSTTTTINLGLHTNDGGQLSPAAGLAAVEGCFGPADQVYHLAAGKSGEPTLVVIYAGVISNLQTQARVLCELARQDCVAVRVHHQPANPLAWAGVLIGPKAAEWGPFNPDFFTTAEEAAAAAATREASTVKA